jgi:hypothetical protein
VGKVCDQLLVDGGLELDGGGVSDAPVNEDNDLRCMSKSSDCY